VIDLRHAPLPSFRFCASVSLFTTAGKTGIGGVKRPPSPTALERAAKLAKRTEALSADDFRDRARKEYEDRRAEGRLRHVVATCVNLDTKTDVEVCMDARLRGEILSCGSPFPHLTFPSIQFNRFWLDPTNPESFPTGLLEALEELLSSSSSAVPDPGVSDTTKSGRWGGPDPGTTARLKAQMQADALRPLNPGSVGSDEDEDGERPLRMGTAVDPDRIDPVEAITVWPEETLLQVGDYLRLSVSRFLRFPLVGYRFRILFW
jgi:hypothetical protein